MNIGKPTKDVIRIGAVAYDAKVVTIWEGFKSYFEARGTKIDYVFYSNYNAQVDALLNDEIEIAWNSPLAWIKAQLKSHGDCQALAMRDSDRDLTTKILIRKNSGIENLTELKGKTIAVGAIDSPQATLIPLSFVAAAGVEPGKDCQVLYHNVMVGKHGDHIGGERDATRALASGNADAACILDGNYTNFVNEGTLDPGTTEILASTPPYDHCNFTAKRDIPDVRRRMFTQTLLDMSFQDPEVRPYMDMEGLKQWVPARTTGYEQLEQAVTRFEFFAERLVVGTQ
jgi:ABC-type phosphate/phosphonate transport system substrate-binding protein